MGVRDIARTMDLSPTIVQRLLHSLSDANFIKQDAETQKYSLGYRALAIGRSLLSEDELVSNAFAAVKRLASDHHLNAYLSTISQGKLTYVLAEQSSGPIAIKIKPGSEAKFHSTAMGKALLSAHDQSQVLELLGSAPLIALTEKTITSKEAFIEELNEIRERGYALAFGENLDGVTSVAARIRNAQADVIAALSVAYAPSLQPLTQLETVIKLVAEAACEISLSLGCPEEQLDKVAPILRASDVA